MPAPVSVSVSIQSTETDQQNQINREYILFTHQECHSVTNSNYTVPLLSSTEIETRRMSIPENCRNIYFRCTHCAKEIPCFSS